MTIRVCEANGGVLPRQVLIDADGCPVVDLTLQIAKRFSVPVIILCDTSHQIEREGAQTLVFDKGADSVDFALVNRVKPGDIVVTQDYELASMCLANRPESLPVATEAYKRKSRRFKRISGRVRLLVLFFITSLTPGQPSGSIRTCRGKTPPFALQTQMVMCVPLSPSEMLLLYANQCP